MSALTVPCRVSGIPGQARLLSYSPFRSGRRGHIDNWLPDDPEEFEFEILDRRGRPAPWLERKLTGQDICDIETALGEALAEERESSREYTSED